jgi:hypothetical protein
MRTKSNAKDYYIYLMSCGQYNWQKIGISTRPQGREKDITVPFKLELSATHVIANNLSDAVRVESEVHKLLHYLRIKQEWFHSVTVEVFEEALKEVTDNPNRRYIGVTHSKQGSYVAKIRVQGEVRHVGSFSTAKRAAEAYDRASKLWYGNSRPLNFSIENS